MDTINFIKEQIVNYSNLDIQDWNNVQLISSFQYFNDFICDSNGFIMRLNDNNETVNVIFQYNPYADFEYFTSSQIIYDDSLAFQPQVIENCLNNMFGLHTYDIRKQAPSNGSTIVYTFGDIVLINEYNEQFASADKPYCRARATACLPLIYEYRG